MEVHGFDVPQLLGRDLSCAAGVRQREMGFVVRVSGRQEGAQKLFSDSFSHRTELTPERSNPFRRTCIDPSAEVATDPSAEVATDPSTEVDIDPSTKVAMTQSPSRPPLVRTDLLSEMLLCWGPSFF